MADDVNPQAGVTPENVNPDNQGADIQENNGSDSSQQPDNVRKLQSDRDRYRSQADKSEERLRALEEQVGYSTKEKAIGGFLEENKDKYPDVEKNDLLYAGSEEELTELAKQSQAKADRIRNKALEDVQQVPDDSLTEEEFNKQVEELEKDVNTSGRSGFQRFLELKSKRR